MVELMLADKKNSLQITQILEITFSAAHFYHQINWSDKKNHQNFGKCYTKFGHGHNYRLELAFIDSTAELSFEKSKLYKKNLQILEKVIHKLDHQHLNFQIDEFKTKIPTTENILIYIRQQLISLGLVGLKWLKLYEMDDLWVECYE